MTLRVSHADLQRRFSARAITFDQPGFYDTPEFLRAETADPGFLNFYARFIDTLPVSSDYIAKARREIPTIAEQVRGELAPNQHSQCANVNMILSRILEQEGFWNYMVRGALTLSFPASSGLVPLHFWTHCQSGEVSHVWLVAPPFMVVDITVKSQPYPKPAYEYIPSSILAVDTTPCEADLDDIFDGYYLRELARQGVTRMSALKGVSSDLTEFIRSFRPSSITCQEGVRLKYVPCGIAAPDAALEAMRQIRFNQRYGFQVYNELVKPALAEIRAGQV